MASEALHSLGNAREVFADTSYFFALLNVRDPHHSRALRISGELATRGLEVYGHLGDCDRNGHAASVPHQF